MTISAPKSPSSDEIDRKLPWLVVGGVVLLATIIFGLGRLAIVNSDRRDAEKKRGDAEARRGDDLQKSIDALSKRNEEDRQFFEIVRGIITAQGAEERQALTDQLRGFQFTTTTTTTPTPATRSSNATPTTSTPSVTSAPPATSPSPPPSTTTTTQPPPPPPNPSCIPLPFTTPLCPSTARSTGRNNR